MRGRSFLVSLLSELSASMICEEIGLPITSVLVNAAGKFIMLVPNTEDAVSKLNGAEKTINEWLVRIAYGETLFGISSIETSCDDLISGNFIAVLDKMDAAADEKKHAPIDVGEYSHINNDYLDRFKNYFTPPACWLCNKRPSETLLKNIDEAEDDKAICNICRDQIFIGTNIVKPSRYPTENKLLEKIFGRYQLEFKDGKILIKSNGGKLHKSWQLEGSEDHRVVSTRKYISGYVPVHSDDQSETEFLEKLTGKEDIIEEIVFGVPKTFNYIACMAKIEKNGKVHGIEALGVLKADVDNLGLIMSCGIAEERNNLSRMTAFSRQMNHFFTVFLPEYLKNHYKNVYTVFAGGDDLFLIGPWNEIIDLSYELRNRFEDYVCKNSQLHFSAGITIHKPGVSVESITTAAEKALEKSKNRFSEKNRFTLFSQTEKWETFEDLRDIRDKLQGWIDHEILNKAMLHRLNNLIRLVEEEKKLLSPEKSSITLSELGCTRWRYLLTYSIERNVSVKDDTGITKEQFKEELTASMDQYGDSMIIPLWQVLYNLR